MKTTQGSGIENDFGRLVCVLMKQTQWSGKNHLRRLMFESNPESWKGPALLSSLGSFAKENERLKKNLSAKAWSSQETERSLVFLDSKE